VAPKVLHDLGVRLQNGTRLLAIYIERPITVIESASIFSDENSRDLYRHQRNSEKAIRDLDNPAKNRKIFAYSNFL
jgi:hypothetical protein